MSIFVFDVQRFTLQDGPGIRTTVFLKGCGLRCKWCHNPESLSRKKTLLYYGDKCVLCGSCQAVCTQSVHYVSGELHEVDHQKCVFCGQCVKNCAEKALEIAGEEQDEEFLFRQIMRDAPFYKNTNGGVTFSGGEPLLQAKELKPLIKRCRAAGIHTAVETASYVPWTQFQEILPDTDLWLCDVKAVTKEVFAAGCGADNTQILDNLVRLSQTPGVSMWIRVPLIPGFNNRPEELKKIAAFIQRLGETVTRIDVLPYHDIGKTKYDAMGKHYPWENHPILSDEEVACAKRFLQCQMRK